MYTTNLYFQVFAIIAAFEDLPCEKGGPDYRAIYRFLSQCMKNDKHEDLEQLEALGKFMCKHSLFSVNDITKSI